MARKFPRGVDLQNQRGINAADPSVATDLATKQYVDNVAAGQAWKAPVRAATTANGTLATAFANGQTIDGVVLATGNRILIKDQTDSTQNGIYVVTAGAPTRAPDADTTAELEAATTYVVEGTVNGDQSFTQTTNAPQIGVDAIVFVQTGGSGTVYTAGDGLNLVGSEFSVALATGGGLEFSAGEVRIVPTYSGLAKRYSADSSTNATDVYTHNLGTEDVIVQVRIAATGEVVDPDIVVTDANTVTLTWAVAPTAGQYRTTILA